MKFGYILRLGTLSAVAGFAMASGCGGANSSDFFSAPAGPGDTGGLPGADGGRGDASQGRDPRVDSGTPPEPDAGSNLGIRCEDGNAPPKTFCDPDTTSCCIATPTLLGVKSYTCTTEPGECVSNSNTTKLRVDCDGDSDCPDGRRCCGHPSEKNQNQFDRITCDKVDVCERGKLHLCNTSADCATGGCTGTDPVNSAYHFCR
ncbi:hypothetical protein [Pendulispora albinea]|uniref:Uncharacterized protein n=1 Tax=Pendulispora albinea TaxID=2741071 RepID=A0ABZ2LTM5_9BACT